MAEARHEIYKLRGWKFAPEDAKEMEQLVELSATRSAPLPAPERIPTIL